MNIRKPKVPALKPERQALVVKSQQMHDGRLEIMHMNLVANDGKPEFIGFSVGKALFNAAARQKHGETIWVVIAT
jgi:hypothetical protein